VARRRWLLGRVSAVPLKGSHPIAATRERRAALILRRSFNIDSRFLPILVDVNSHKMINFCQRSQSGCAVCRRWRKRAERRRPPNPARFSSHREEIRGWSVCEAAMTFQVQRSKPVNKHVSKQSQSNPCVCSISSFKGLLRQVKPGRAVTIK